MAKETDQSYPLSENEERERDAYLSMEKVSTGNEDCNNRDFGKSLENFC